MGRTLSRGQQLLETTKSLSHLHPTAGWLGDVLFFGLALAFVFVQKLFALAACQWEQERNTLIEQEQGNRNPFIDQPELVERVGNF